MYCPNCGEEVKENSKFCNNCGENLENNKGKENEIVNQEKTSNKLVNNKNRTEAKEKWYKRKWLVILTLILFFPLGLLLMWNSNDFGKKSKIVISGIFLLLILFGMFSPDDSQRDLVADPVQTTTENTATYNLKINTQGEGDIKPAKNMEVERNTSYTVTAVPDEGWKFTGWEGIDIKEETIKVTMDDNKKLTAVFDEIISDISYQEIESNYENMTDVQFEDYKEKIIGKKVIWTGHVEEVKEQMLNDKYEVWIDVDSTDAIMSTQEVYLKDLSKDRAFKLKKGEVIKFKGRISNIVDFMGAQVNLKEIAIY